MFLVVLLICLADKLKFMIVNNIIMFNTCQV